MHNVDIRSQLRSQIVRCVQHFVGKSGTAQGKCLLPRLLFCAFLARHLRCGLGSEHPRSKLWNDDVAQQGLARGKGIGWSCRVETIYTTPQRYLSRKFVSQDEYVFLQTLKSLINHVSLQSVILLPATDYPFTRNKCIRITGRHRFNRKHSKISEAGLGAPGH